MFVMGEGVIMGNCRNEELFFVIFLFLACPLGAIGIHRVSSCTP